MLTVFISDMESPWKMTLSARAAIFYDMLKFQKTLAGSVHRHLLSMNLLLPIIHRHLVPMNYFSQLISLFMQATRKTYKYELLLFFLNTFIFIQGEACYAFAKAIVILNDVLRDLMLPCPLVIGREPWKVLCLGLLPAFLLFRRRVGCRGLFSDPTGKAELLSSWFLSKQSRIAVELPTLMGIVVLIPLYFPPPCFFRRLHRC